MRTGDLLGRQGGEEFAVFLRDGTESAAATMAERLRVTVRDDVPHPSGPRERITVSGGVAPVPRHFEPEAALSSAISAADAALYVAKRDGRDRIVTAVPVPAAQLRLDATGAT
jgi:diguanylate cyclase (GGDEF)-like protein